MLLHSGRLRRGEQLQLPRETENGLLGQRLNEREAGTGASGRWTTRTKLALPGTVSQAGQAPGQEKSQERKKDLGRNVGRSTKAILLFLVGF